MAQIAINAAPVTPTLPVVSDALSIMRSMISYGQGGAAEFGQPARVDALAGMERLALRDPQRLAEIIVGAGSMGYRPLAGAVSTLITYRRTGR